MTQQLFQCSNEECGKQLPAEEMKAPFFRHGHYFGNDEDFQRNLTYRIRCKTCSEDYGSVGDDEFHYPLLQVLQRREDEKNTKVLDLGWKDDGEDEPSVYYCLEIHPEKGLRLRSHDTYFNASESSASEPVYSSTTFVAQFIAEFLQSITRDIEELQAREKLLITALVACTNGQPTG